MCDGPVVLHILTFMSLGYTFLVFFSYRDSQIYPGGSAPSLKRNRPAVSQERSMVRWEYRGETFAGILSSQQPRTGPQMALLLPGIVLKSGHLQSLYSGFS